MFSDRPTTKILEFALEKFQVSLDPDIAVFAKLEIFW